MCTRRVDPARRLLIFTAYDFSTAWALNTHDVDIALVGDSLTQDCLGLPSTNLRRDATPNPRHRARRRTFATRG